MTTSCHHRGFTLVEVLVAVLIGMIATVVIFQVFEVSERQKRTTTGTSDAQGNGAISIATMQRDIEAAGWGLQLGSFSTKTAASGCDTMFTHDVTTGGPIDGHGGTSLLQNISIADGGNAADSIVIQYYDTPENQSFTFGVAAPAIDITDPDGHVILTSAAGCSVESLMLVADKDNCSLMQVSAMATNASGKIEISHDAGGVLRYNKPAPSGWQTYNTKASVQCFPAFYQRTYSVAARELQVTDFRVPRTTNGGTVPVTNTIASGIMDLQAEYGVRAIATDPIRWVKGTDLPPTAANIRMIVAVRIALIARNSEYQKPADGSTDCDATTPTMVGSWSTWAQFSTANYPGDWQCYRYKEFETVIPLRNAIWAGL